MAKQMNRAGLIMKFAAIGDLTIIKIMLGSDYLREPSGQKPDVQPCATVRAVDAKTIGWLRIRIHGDDDVVSHTQFSCYGENWF